MCCRAGPAPWHEGKDMKYIMGIYSWLNIATGGILFGPDREEVRRELQQHIEDKAMDLARIFPDMEEREVHERALREMGDPWELKRELGKIHRPWLGYVWRFTQIMIWGVLALMLLAVLDSGFGFVEEMRYGFAESRESRAVGRALYEDGTPNWEGERLVVYDVDAKARFGGSVISVTRAARWREPEGERVYLRLRIDWDRPWEAEHMAVCALCAEDGLGNTYKIGAVRSAAKGWRWYQWDLILEGVPLEAGELHIHSVLRDGLDLAVGLTEEAPA